MTEQTPFGNKTTYTYDADNRQVTMVEPVATSPVARRPHTVDVHVRPGRQPTHRKSPLNHTTAFTYDANNNQLTKLDALAHTTTWTYDALNRLKR